MRQLLKLPQIDLGRTGEEADKGRDAPVSVASSEMEGKWWEQKAM